MIMKMLIENNSVSKDFKKEHGLSIYIESQGKKILFDTGFSGAFMENAGKMGILIGDIDEVIISHAHIDHTGGLVKFFEVNKKAPVYMCRKANEACYLNVFLKKDISAPPKIFAEYADRICFIDNPFTQISDDKYIVAEFARHYPLVKSSKNLLIKRQGKLDSDNFDHELALVMDNNGKLVILTGCSHNGIDNMIETAARLFPEKPIQSVVGGFHLMGLPILNVGGESKANVTKIGRRLLDFNIDKIYTCHCTGSKEYHLLKECMGDKLEYLATGMQVII
jgi:7,8-dihydropterin-6-yl-methyl-4-(beta-D-ribofuranosyl)aminobenzene 5'-phosphate synthase